VCKVPTCAIVSAVGDKLTIGEARARRTDPVWRRRHKLADLTGIALVALLLVALPVAAALGPSPFAVAALALLVVAPVAIWLQGPVVGLERRAALLVAIPVVNLVVLVPAVWRTAHLHLQRWQGPLDPRWDDSVWRLVGAAALVLWLATVAALVWLLA
jgi:hypothetical protein